MQATDSFPYSQNNGLDLIHDTVWMKTNTEKYLNIINDQLSKGVIKEEDHDYIVWFRILRSYVVLNKNQEGLDLIEKMMATKIIKQRELTYLGIFYGYFMRQLGSDYLTAERDFYKEKTASLEDKEMVLDTYTKANLLYWNPLAFATNDTSKLQQYINSYTPGINRPVKQFTLNEMPGIITSAAYFKLAAVVGAGHELFATELAPIVAAEEKERDEKGKQLWAERQYHFLPTDKPVFIVAANFQLFDKANVLASQLWTNKKDEHGIMYIDGKGLLRAPIPSDSSDAKKYFEPGDDANPAFQHGNMTIELILKDNPYVKIMGLEHNQYDFTWSDLKKKFTSDIAANRRLIDSVVKLKIDIWKELAIYCRQNKVRVAEINSLSLLLNDLNLKGCGNNESETKNYTTEKFYELVKGFEDAFKKSPKTLFVISAGNDNTDNVSNKKLNMCIHTPNLITAGALYKDFKRARYSNFGKDVDIYAPANFALQSANTIPESGGTSASSPVVCNLAIKLFCLNPRLTPEQVKALIIDSSDKDLFEKDINIINPKKAVALLAATK